MKRYELLCSGEGHASRRGQPGHQDLLAYVDHEDNVPVEIVERSIEGGFCDACKHEIQPGPELSIEDQIAALKVSLEKVSADAAVMAEAGS